MSKKKKSPPVKAESLRRGLQNTSFWLYRNEGGWEGSSRHDVIYVNRSDREIVMRVFSSTIVLSFNEFDSRQYRVE